MSVRAATAGFIGLWLGVSLLLSTLRWAGRRSLGARVGPHLATVASAGRGRSPSGPGTVDALRRVLVPTVVDIGARASRALGIDEDLRSRLERVGSPLDISGFRMRQIGWCGAALLLATIVPAGIDLPPIVRLGLVAGAPVLAFAVVEQRIASLNDRWKERVRRELPVIEEHLGMLLASGLSLSAAISRLGRRGSGNVATDLRRVSRRIRQGIGEQQALREWADRSDVDAVGRLVAILSLEREANDLAALISAEARLVRGEVHRSLIEAIGRRAQAVWIPVTVATLVPGVIFMAVPFVDAMHQLGGR